MNHQPCRCGQCGGYGWMHVEPRHDQSRTCWLVACPVCGIGDGYPLRMNDKAIDSHSEQRNRGIGYDGKG